MNLIEALKMGNGIFLKLHNDYSVFTENALNNMLICIKQNVNENSVLFFSNGVLKINSTRIYNSFDSFMCQISYYSSWTTLLGFWKNDFDTLKDAKLEPMFPHTSLLFNMPLKHTYIINDIELFINQPIPQKGGYNLFEVFGVVYIGMVYEIYRKEEISFDTLRHIKCDMFKHFFVPWYANTQLKKNDYTFMLSNIKKSMDVYYSGYYYLLIINAFLYVCISTIKKATRIIYRMIFAKFSN
jgi:hypothetical protein